MKFIYGFLMLVARWSIAALFIWSSANKFLSFDQTSLYMASKGLNYIPLFLVGAAAVEFFGGLTLLFGFKTRLGATLLFIYLIPVTLIFHDFWNLAPADQNLQQIMFLKNLAIIGGLLYVITNGAGYFAVDAFRKKPLPAPKPSAAPLQEQTLPENKVQP